MPLPYFPITEAYLIGAWCGAAVWGVYTLLIGTTLYFTYVKYSQTGCFHHKISTTLVTIIWVLATTHLSLELRRLIQAFILLPPDFPGGILAYLGSWAEPLNRNKSMVYITILWLSDLIIVWRCWVVWGKNWAVTTLPIIMVTGTAVAGYGAIGQLSSVTASDSAYLEKLHTAIKWGDAMFIVSLSTNTLVTLLTAFRIWMVTRKSSVMLAVNGPSRARSALLLLIESGAFVFTIKLLELILYKLTPSDGIHGLNALYVVFDVTPQVVGLMPTLIVLTVNARVSMHDYITAKNTIAPSATNTGGPLVFGNGVRSGVTTTIGGSSTFQLPNIKRDMESGDIELTPGHLKDTHGDA